MQSFFFKELWKKEKKKLIKNMNISLENLSLEIICKNLQLIFTGLKNWNIPLGLQNSIFLFFSKNMVDINEKDLEIFSSSQFSISLLILHRNFFKFPKFFSKINTELIKEICLFFDLDKNCYDCIEILSKRIQNIRKFYVDFSLQTKLNENENFSDGIVKALNLIVPFLGEELVEFVLTLPDYYSNAQKYFPKFEKNLKICKNLKTLKITGRLLTHVELKSFENIEELTIDVAFGLENEEKINFLNQFKNLKILSITWDMKPEIKINFTILKQFLLNSPTLKSLEIFSNCSILTDTFRFICETFQSLKKLTFNGCRYWGEILFKIQINNYNNTKNISTLKLSQEYIDLNDLKLIIEILKDKRYFNEIFIETSWSKNSKNHSNLLEYFNEMKKLVKELNINLSIENNDDFNKIFSLKESNLSIKLNFSRNPCETATFYHLNHQSFSFKFDIIKQLNFYNVNLFKIFENYRNTKEFFMKFSFLEKVCFHSMEINEIFNDISLGLLNSSNHLTDLNFFDCNLKSENRNCFKALIYGCNKLECLNIADNEEFINESILIDISNLSKNFEKLSFTCSIKFLPQIYKMIKEFRRMSNLSIAFTDGIYYENILKGISNVLWNYSCSYFDEESSWRTYYKKSIIDLNDLSKI